MRADFDYSRDAVLRSFEASLERLDTPYIDMLAIHDPDEAVDVGAGVDPFSRSQFKAAMDGAFPALAELRSQGVIKAIGVGINQWQMLCDFATAGDFDYFLLAGRYTLLDQDLMPRLFPLCDQRSISLVVGGPYNSRHVGVHDGRLRLPAGLPRDPGSGAQDRSRLRASWRFAASRRTAIPAAPSVGREHHPRRAIGRRGEGEFGVSARAHTAGVLGGAKARTIDR